MLSIAPSGSRGRFHTVGEISPCGTSVVRGGAVGKGARTFASAKKRLPARCLQAGGTGHRLAETPRASDVEVDDRRPLSLTLFDVQLVECDGLDVHASVVAVGIESLATHAGAEVVR